MTPHQIHGQLSEAIKRAARIQAELSFGHPKLTSHLSLRVRRMLLTLRIRCLLDMLRR
jgi:hypothetical protein